MTPRPTPPLFQRGDLSAFWALFADNLANVVIAAGVCLTVFQMPGEVVFGRIVPGVALALIFGLGLYGRLAWTLARREGRADVTALPYGISTPVMFVYLFGILGPAYAWLQASGAEDPSLQAWRVGIAAAFVGGVVEVLGSLVGPWLKRLTPRAGMLGTLAGIAVVWIATVPLAEIFEHPLVGFTSLAIVLVGLVAGLRLPWGVPAGLAAIVAGTGMALALGESQLDLQGFGLSLPVPVLGDLLAGLELLVRNPQLLVVVLPIEIYNFVETMSNVESAESAGDRYPVARCQVYDGLGTALGAAFGSPFPTTVYIGHPAYKKLGAGVGYGVAVGAVFALAGFTGLIQTLYALIPAAAVAPILVFIGIVIASQAFTSTPARHGLAVAVAFIPHIASLVTARANAALTAAGQRVDDAFTADLLAQGFHWMGQSALSQGAILTGLLWGAITAHLIDRRLGRAAAFATAAAALSLIGVLHAPQLGLHLDGIFYGYLLVAGLFLAMRVANAGDPQEEA